MMKLKILILLSLLTGSGIGTAKANYYTAGGVLSDCESKKAVEQAYCMTYLAGISDAHNALVFWKNLGEPKFCAPKGATQNQLREVFIKYANENPQSLHLAAASVVMNAFYKEFPCA